MFSAWPWSVVPEPFEDQSWAFSPILTGFVPQAHVAIEMGREHPDPALCRLHSPAEAMAGVSARPGVDEVILGHVR